MLAWPFEGGVELILILELIGILEFDQGRGIIYSSDDLEDDQTRNEMRTKRGFGSTADNLSAATYLKRTDCFLSSYLAKQDSLLAFLQAAPLKKYIYIVE